MLTGSQRKTAFALRKNIETMIAGSGERTLKTIETKERKTDQAYICDHPKHLDKIGFLTLTVGDWEKDLAGKRKFSKIYDAKEASRRINNLNRRILKDLFSMAIIVTERHKDGGIHFHIIGILTSGANIRSGFNFKEFKRIRKSGKKFCADEVGASKELAAIWKKLREVLPRYGFGRAELTPIEKTGEAVGAYVSKYIEKNICNRIEQDKRKKLVRYIGWKEKVKIQATEKEPEKTITIKTQLKAAHFSWATKRATAWRMKARAMASLVNIYEKEEMAKHLGARWAHFVSSLWQRITGSDEQPFLIADFHQTELMRVTLVKRIGLENCKRLDRNQRFDAIEKLAIEEIRLSDERKFKEIELSEDISNFLQEMEERDWEKN